MLSAARRLSSVTHHLSAMTDQKANDRAARLQELADLYSKWRAAYALAVDTLADVDPAAGLQPLTSASRVHNACVLGTWILKHGIKPGGGPLARAKEAIHNARGAGRQYLEHFGRTFDPVQIGPESLQYLNEKGLAEAFNVWVATTPLDAANSNTMKEGRVKLEENQPMDFGRAVLALIHERDFTTFMLDYLREQHREALPTASALEVVRQIDDYARAHQAILEDVNFKKEDDPLRHFVHHAVAITLRRGVV
jgi:hypothetical protein